MPEKTPLLQLSHVDMVFEKPGGLCKPPQKIPVLLDANLEIYPAEVLALVGESGGGKTTVGNLVTSILTPSAGTMYFNGKDVHKMNRRAFREYRNSVQLVQQDSYASFNPVKLISSSLVSPMLQRGVVRTRREAYERAREMLRIVGLTPEALYLDKYPHQLSGGQRQRLLLARAIAMKPKLIVADEPVSMIDVSLRISILNLMAELNRTLGIAFLYITHDFATAKYIAHGGRIAVMYLGKIVESGPVREVVRTPRHPYLQALLTAVPVPDPTVAKKKRPLPLKSMEMPSVTHPPDGCRFHPRCPYATERCASEEPVTRRIGNSLVCCHRAEELPPWDLYEQLR